MSDEEDDIFIVKPLQRIRSQLSQSSTNGPNKQSRLSLSQPNKIAKGARSKKQSSLSLSQWSKPSTSAASKKQSRLSLSQWSKPSTSAASKKQRSLSLSQCGTLRTSSPSGNNRVKCKIEDNHEIPKLYEAAKKMKVEERDCKKSIEFSKITDNDYQEAGCSKHTAIKALLSDSEEEDCKKGIELSKITDNHYQEAGSSKLKAIKTVLSDSEEEDYKKSIEFSKITDNHYQEAGCSKLAAMKMLQSDSEEEGHMSGKKSIVLFNSEEIQILENEKQNLISQSPDRKSDDSFNSEEIQILENENQNLRSQSPEMGKNTSILHKQPKELEAAETDSLKNTTTNNKQPEEVQCNDVDFFDDAIPDIDMIRASEQISSDIENLTSFQHNSESIFDRETVVFSSSVTECSEIDNMQGKKGLQEDQKSVCSSTSKQANKSPEKGKQTSLLNFFQAKGKKSHQPDKKPAYSQCGVASTCSDEGSQASASVPWKGLMARMQAGQAKPKTVPTSTLQAQDVKETQQKTRPKSQQRKCPFYKYIPETGFVVDAFGYGTLDGVKAYFLTHFHYDHYRGLSKKFDQPIYCSEITGRLVTQRLNVPLKYLHLLPMEEPRVVCGVEVTLLEANHCPGAVMFLFKLVTGATVLHVGDFRANSKMEMYPALWNCSIDTLYLDTTYCNENYNFPSQEDVIEKCVSIASSHVKEDPSTLIVVGSYTIGKERVFKAIAAALDCKIWASSDKQRTLRCINDSEITDRLVSDKFIARVHVLPMAELQTKKLMSYINTMKPRYTQIVSIRPTGWEHSSDQGQEDIVSRRQFGNVYTYGIPYSEHSSFNELRRFVQFVQPKKIIPTVNVGNPNTRTQMENYFKEWLKKSKYSFLSPT